MDIRVLQFSFSSLSSLFALFLLFLLCHVRDFHQSLGYGSGNKSLPGDFLATANKTPNMMLRPNNPSSCKIGKTNESNFSWKIAPIILIGSLVVKVKELSNRKETGQDYERNRSKQSNDSRMIKTTESHAKKLP